MGLVDDENHYMKLVDDLNPALENVIKEAGDVEEAQKKLEESVAKDVEDFKKLTARQKANIERQTQAVQQQGERQEQLTQQKINSVQKAVDRAAADAEAAK